MACGLWPPIWEAGNRNPFRLCGIYTTRECRQRGQVNLRCVVPREHKRYVHKLRSTKGCSKNFRRCDRQHLRKMSVQVVAGQVARVGAAVVRRTTTAPTRATCLQPRVIVRLWALGCARVTVLAIITHTHAGSQPQFDSSRGPGRSGLLVQVRRRVPRPSGGAGNDK